MFNSGKKRVMIGRELKGVFWDTGSVLSLYLGDAYTL